MDTVFSTLILAQSADAKPTVGYGTMIALVVFILASMWIGMLANRAMQAGAFMKGFFLGNRGLGAWALALTATVQSGGTFMGFPSLVYTHGWVVALWICREPVPKRVRLNTLKASARKSSRFEESLPPRTNVLVIEMFSE